VSRVSVSILEGPSDIEVFRCTGPAEEVAEAVAEEFEFFVGEDSADAKSVYVVEIKREAAA
jgi:hypothetical protein